jgi:hypothetical protein
MFLIIRQYKDVNPGLKLSNLNLTRGIRFCEYSSLSISCQTQLFPINRNAFLPIALLISRGQFKTALL